MPRNVKAPLAGWLVCVGGLILLALLVFGVGPAQRLDASILVRFIAEPGSAGDLLAARLARLGDPPAQLLMLALACGIGLMRGRPRSAVAALVVVAGANLTTQALKVALAHPRFQSLLGAEQLSWNSFPSGHTTAAAAIALAFAFVVPRGLRPLVAVLGTCLVVAMGCSVLVLAWHYPTDVVGGVLVAGAWGFATLAALRLVEGAPSRRPVQLGRRAAISLK